MFQIDYIRHTSLNVSPNLCYGQTDIPVSDTFHSEAEAVRQSIQNNKYDAIFTSPLCRARQLCDFCGYEQKAVIEPRVMERNFGDWELMQWSQVNDLVRDHEDPALFTDHLGQIAPPNGETVENFLTRVYDFIQDVRLMRHKRVAIFCHGGVINSARYFQELLTIENLFIDIPPYGSITTLSYSFADEKQINLYKL